MVPGVSGGTCWRKASIAACIASIPADFGPLTGIGLAVQGLVHKNETLVWSPALSVRQVNIAAPLAARFNLPVIAMTAHNLANEWRQCREAGMNDYITKPIDVPVLLNVIGRWMSPRL